MLVFSCVYSAQIFILFLPALARDERTNLLTVIVYCVLALVPALAFIFNRKRCIATLIQVGSIGTFVLPHCIAESEREEKTSMAVRILVIVFKLARMTNAFLADTSCFKLEHANGHYTNVLSEEEIAELGRIFNFYLDQDGDNTLSQTEFQSLMSHVGISMSIPEANGLFTALTNSIKSHDDEAGKTSGDAGISKDMFYQWYANQLGDSDDKKECAEFWFHLFDEDNSGDITVLEFVQQLDKLALGISHAEADELLEELDQDGNGVLCEEEFRDMIEHFYPIEFEEVQ